MGRWVEAGKGMENWRTRKRQLGMTRLPLAERKKCLLGSGFAEAIAEALNAATHVVHGFLCAGVKRM